MNYTHNGITIYHGCCLDVLPTLPEQSVHCCVTSPPYYSLRDYGVDSQIGLEPTLDEFVAKMVEVFRAVWRVLRDDGTLWLNLGDSYNAYNHNRGGSPSLSGRGRDSDRPAADPGLSDGFLKQKDLLGVPWRVALALQADGWYLRSDIIWHKPNPMPESVTDRPTKSHEYLFLLTKSPRYYYDAEAVKEPMAEASAARYEYEFGGPKSVALVEANKTGIGQRTRPVGDRVATNGRNLRDVWTIPSKSYKGAHFATFPPKLIEPCIKAGTSEEGCCPECGAPWKRVIEKNRVATRPGRDNVNDPTGMANRDPERHVTSTKTTGWESGCECNAGPPVPCTVLDPFIGSGTTAEVARANGCKAIGCELSAEYIALAANRLEQGSLFST